PRFSAIIDGCARICAGEQLRLIQFNRPRPETNPVCKARWSLQRVVAFTAQKIAQTKLCRILVHHSVHFLSFAPFSSNAVSHQNGQFLSFTKLLTTPSAVSAPHGSTVSGQPI